MFPLKQRKIGGYIFGQRTFYAAHHLGTDYVATKGTQLFAPFDGVIKTTLNGKQGGLTIWFKPNNANVIMRFMHLSAFKVKAGEKVKEGQIIALTGNTGSATTGAHLHVDISKNAVNIANFSNFLDPEKYQWEDPKQAPKLTQDVSKTPKSINIPVQDENVTSELPEASTSIPVIESLAQVIAKEVKPTLGDRIKAFFEKIINLIINANK